MPRRTFLVEVSDRVAEVIVRRSRHRSRRGLYRWRVTVRLLSGPGLTKEEVAESVRRVVANLAACGNILISWRVKE